MNDELLEIAKKVSPSVRSRGDLERRNNDSEDFIEISVWSLKELMEKAYNLGKSK